MEKFKDIFQFAPKSKIKAGEGLDKGRFPFYTSSAIQNKWIDTEQHFDEALIFGTGGSASIHYESQPFSTSTDCFVTITTRRDVNTKYVYYFLASNIHLLERGFKGAGLKHLSKAFLEEIEFPLPDLETQNKIVAILDKAKAILDKREETIKMYDELLRATFLEMFGDPVLNNKGWEVDLLANLAKLERGRFSPRPRNDPSYFSGEYPFIQTGDIANSNHRLSNYSQTLNEKGIAVSKEFNAGDIVIAIVGATIGATAILQRNVYATDSIIGIKPKENIVNNVFIEMLLRFYKQILLDTAPEAARANINLSIIGNLKCIIPPISLQKRFAIAVEKIEIITDKLNKSKKHIENLAGGLSQQAFKGELDFNTAVDLEVLLENDYQFFKENSNSGSIKLLIERLNTDELNENRFYEQQTYDKAKNFVFELIKEGKVKQIFDEQTKKVKLTV